ncbi:hypothetical protein TNCT_610251 [Trichonephila clavata]|uniref:Uncharacterized protein n=1 Tax=Trichonephila clavata TaxID=2740835 RepID=A0A8X6LVE9_TRICU|nr:hypothetical protein TNCT_610251 [Trichonephila clavata]
MTWRRSWNSSATLGSLICCIVSEKLDAWVAGGVGLVLSAFGGMGGFLACGVGAGLGGGGELDLLGGRQVSGSGL